MIIMGMLYQNHLTPSCVVQYRDPSNLRESVF